MYFGFFILYVYVILIKEYNLILMENIRFVFLVIDFGIIE